MVSLFWLLTLQAFSLDCNDLYRAQQRVLVHATNLANSNSTRTDDGTVYRVRRLDCTSDPCQIISEVKTKTKYAPGHPDANSDGYVTFPDINPIRERAGLNAAARELRLLAKASVCPQIKLGLDSVTEISLDFTDAAQPLKREKLSFSDRQEVSSWSRVYQSGQEETLTF